MSKIKLSTKVHIDWNRTVNIGILVILMCAATIVNPSFLTLSNLLGILEQNAAKGVMALGVMFVLITGGIDLAMETGLTMIAVVHHPYQCRRKYGAAGAAVYLDRRGTRRGERRADHKADVAAIRRYAWHDVRGGRYHVLGLGR